MSVSDYASVITAVVAFVALSFGLYTFARQKTSADVVTILSIFIQINDYWDRYQISENERQRIYYLGQILSYYENACFLINRKIVTADAAECISGHIYDVWSNLNNTTELKAQVSSLMSSDTTFCEIQRFTSRRNLNN